MVSCMLQNFVRKFRSFQFTSGEPKGIASVTSILRPTLKGMWRKLFKCWTGWFQWIRLTLLSGNFSLFFFSCIILNIASVIFFNLLLSLYWNGTFHYVFRWPQEGCTGLHNVIYTTSTNIESRFRSAFPLEISGKLWCNFGKLLKFLFPRYNSRWHQYTKRCQG